MSNEHDSADLIAELLQASNNDALHLRYRPRRYEPGHVFRLDITGVHPAVQGRVELAIEAFLGGGFAGQVYRCRVLRLDLPAGAAIPGLELDGLCAVKILLPPSAFSVRFRNAIYWLAFQGPFSAQVNAAACRAGLLWQKLIRRACRVRFGRETAVNDVYASFWDANLHAYGEITEWVDGRQWYLEADSDLTRRWHWRKVDLSKTASREYVAKRRFMAEFVQVMHDMGAPELARQYEWWTLKSQPNVLKRIGADDPDDPASGLCAVDFRAGLALLCFLPMSPGDVRLILAGLFRRGALVQFDRCDRQRLEAFVAEHKDEFADLNGVLAELGPCDRAYRRSLPDITHHGHRLLLDADLRRDVKQGLIDGYRAAGTIDASFAEKLLSSPLRFALFYLLGALPFPGRVARRFWGHAGYRAHVRAALTSPRYFALASRARAARQLIEWHRSGRTGIKRTRFLARHPLFFLADLITLRLCMPVAALLALLFIAGVATAIGWSDLLPLPVHALVLTAIAVPVFAGVALVPAMHRAFTDPTYIARKVLIAFQFAYRFWKDTNFREQYFLRILAEGERDGLLSPQQRQDIEVHIHDPFIVKYLKCLAVHFATFPVTRIVSLVVGGIMAGWMLARGRPWVEAATMFAAVVALLQILPISPGSLCRGGFVVYLMIRERNVKDYLVAAPISFLKSIGYLAFPLQMATSHPELAQFLASRWANSAVRFIPVFGEKGALVEHWVFDLFFNTPRMLAGWCRPRLRGLLTTWMAAGMVLTATVLLKFRMPPLSKGGVNLILASLCVFALPLVLFLSVFADKKPHAKTQ